MYSEYPKVYVVTKVRSYRLQVLGYRVLVLGYRAQVPGRCQSQVPGRQAAGAGQVLDRCWTGAGHTGGRCQADRLQVLGRCWAGAGQVLGRCCRLQVPGRCWAGAAGAGQVWHTGPEVQGISPISPGC